MLCKIWHFLSKHSRSPGQCWHLSGLWEAGFLVGISAVGLSLKDKLELRTVDQGRQRALARRQIKLLVALTQRLICLMERVCVKIMVK